MTKRRYAPRQLNTASAGFFNSWLEVDKTKITDENIAEYFSMVAVAALKYHIPYSELVEKAHEKLAELKALGGAESFTNDDLLEALSVYFDENAVYVKARMMYTLAGLEYESKTKKTRPCNDEHEKKMVKEEEVEPKSSSQ